MAAIGEGAIFLASRLPTKAALVRKDELYFPAWLKGFIYERLECGGKSFQAVEALAAKTKEERQTNVRPATGFWSAGGRGVYHQRLVPGNEARTIQKQYTHFLGASVETKGQLLVNANDK